MHAKFGSAGFYGFEVIEKKDGLETLTFIIAGTVCVLAIN